MAVGKPGQRPEARGVRKIHGRVVGVDEIRTGNTDLIGIATWGSNQHGAIVVRPGAGPRGVRGSIDRAVVRSWRWSAIVVVRAAVVWLGAEFEVEG